MGDLLARLKTDEALLRKLHDSRQPTAAEVREQRISFAYATLDSENTMTREEVRKLVECA